MITTKAVRIALVFNGMQGIVGSRVYDARLTEEACRAECLAYWADELRSGGQKIVDLRVQLSESLLVE